MMKTTIKMILDRRSSLKPMLAIGLLALALAGCSTGSKLVDQLKGTEKPLPGQREDIQLKTSLDDEGAETPASNPVIIPAAITNQDWAQPGGVASNNYQHLTLGPSLTRAFSVKAGQGSEKKGKLTAIPIVVGGGVFVLDSRANVRAFSLQNGQKIWEKRLAPKKGRGKGAFGGGLASDGSRLYVTTALGEVFALDLQTGNGVWQINPKVGTLRNAPVVADGKLFFTSVNNDVIALSSVNGAELWRASGTPGVSSVISSSSPAYANGVIVAPFSTGEIAAYDGNSGLPNWTEFLTSTDPARSVGAITDIAGRPVIVDNTVFSVAHSGRMGAFDLVTGQERWSRELSGTQSPWIAGNYAFVVVENRKLSAVSLSNGGTAWSIDLPRDQVWLRPIVGGNRLVLISSKGMMYELSPQTGQTLNTRDLGRKFLIPPVIASGTLVLLSDDARLIAYR